MPEHDTAYTATELAEIERVYVRAAEIGSDPERIVLDPENWGETASGDPSWNVGAAERYCLIGLVDRAAWEYGDERRGGNVSFLCDAAEEIVGERDLTTALAEGQHHVVPLFKRAIELIHERQEGMGTAGAWTP